MPLRAPAPRLSGRRIQLTRKRRIVAAAIPALERKGILLRQARDDEEDSLGLPVAI
jgi:hypothetical protein